MVFAKKPSGLWAKVGDAHSILTKTALQQAHARHDLPFTGSIAMTGV